MSYCWARVSSPNERAWAIVALRVQWELRVRTIQVKQSCLLYGSPLKYNILDGHMDSAVLVIRLF